jgi:hypothetical protein
MLEQQLAPVNRQTAKWSLVLLSSCCWLLMFRGIGDCQTLIQLTHWGECSWPGGNETTPFCVLGQYTWHVTRTSTSSSVVTPC